ncbi:chromate resistance protein ChrB domain-containing protein [Oryzomicrobium sp.]|uniref:chromate resistance protein ChrB domain-containing protein n=1 Tax=Oryzomicrobium sp. TaxID=1911578 RepID=UPI0025DB7CE6|nr:chromate resistance protein ChrB domain-containing protein [Oryzomicrobium sp.]MCE1243653.1 chromate resistance protein [Oryzomicrobium sp.]
MDWLLFIATLPGQAGSLRLRFWRQLKGIGAVNLRDGVYLLPAQESLRPVLASLRDELIAAEGSAWLVDLPSQSPEMELAWRALFDRSEAYREWRTAFGAFSDRLAEAPETEARRQVRQIRKDLEAIATIDFFPDDQLDIARRALADAERRLTRQFAPDEPEAAEGLVPRLSLSNYQGRLWATRSRLWVDRIASAWLIRRFIDRDARFVWLKDTKDCPPDALGFDFDGAAFTHVGNLVSFETLLVSFGLDTDRGLLRLGALVHGLDVGDGMTPEGQGFEAILEGARQRHTDDDRLLEEISPVLDSLHAYFSLGK